jgi:uridine kinase
VTTDLPPEVRRATDLIRGLRPRPGGAVVVALDGRSGVGKSTLAARLASGLPATVLEGDDFYAGGVDILCDPPERRADRCIDWRDQRRVLQALRQGLAASYHAFDWDAFNGSRQTQATHVAPTAVILLEGVYSARRELADLLDLRILLRVPDDVRLARLLAREGTLGPWEAQWHEAEDWYFAHAAPADGFDLVLDAGAAISGAVRAGAAG